LLNETGYLEHLARASKEDNDPEKRTENIEELIHGLETYEKKFRSKKPTLAGYLQEIAIMNSEDSEDDAPGLKKGVVLMTLHKSKGLEFPVVFLAGLDKDYIPSPKAVQEGNMMKSGGSFYVGMTRARKDYISHIPVQKFSEENSALSHHVPFSMRFPKSTLMANR
jgi:DNA helicase-2/ATP-dependent DNA helicase PcrA